MIDLGFPAHWTPKDTATCLFAALALASTGIALQLQSLAGERKAVLTLPGPPGPAGENDTQRQYRLAELRAGRRATAERGRMYERLANAIFTLSVFAGVVSSLPWLSAIGLVAIAAVGLYAYTLYRQEPRETTTRLAILALVREIHSFALSTPYMFDTTIFGEIDAVFSTPPDRLDDLEQTARVKLLEARNAYNAYVARREAAQAQAQHGDAAANEAG